MTNIGMFIEGTFIPSFEGATRRFQLLAKHLVQSGFNVTIFHCYRGWSDPNLISQEPFLTYFVPPHLYYNDSDLILRLIQAHDIDILIMSEFEPIVRLGGLLKTTFPKLRIFFEVHDIHSDLHKSISATTEHIARTKIAEKAAYLVADLCICFSEEDAKSVSSIMDQQLDISLWNRAFGNSDLNDRNHFDRFTSMKVDKNISRVVQLPFGYNLSNIAPHQFDPNSKILLFLGNQYHIPNKKAVEFLAESIYPRVVTEIPDIKFLIVGDAPQELINLYKQNNFTFLGRISDLNEIFKSVSLALAPMFYGAGIRVKILDYLSAGIPVLATSLAVRGLDEDSHYKHAIAIEDQADKFSTKIIELLRSSEILQSMSGHARKVAEYYSWANIGARTINVFKQFQDVSRNEINLTHLVELSEYINMTSYFFNDYLNPSRFHGLNFQTLEGIWRGGKDHLIPLQI